MAKVHYSENTAKPFAEYLGWQQGRLARVRVTQIFPRKTIQPVTIGVIRLYVRSLLSDGLGGSNPSLCLHQPFIAGAMPSGAASLCPK